LAIQAIGLIETVGMAAAIEACDTAVKAANITLIGYELTKGGGMVTVKFEGDVGAVKVAVEAGSMAAERVGKVFSKHVIPRLGSGVEKVIFSEETVGPKKPSRGKKSNTSEQNETYIIQTITSGLRNKVLELEEILSAGDTHIESEIKKHMNASEESGEAGDVYETDVPTEEKEVCNMCKDPKCLRRKGELKSTCIHYEEIRRSIP
jgi:ethanolamine utilization protein EutM